MARIAAVVVLCAIAHTGATTSRFLQKASSNQTLWPFDQLPTLGSMANPFAAQKATSVPEPASNRSKMQDVKDSVVLSAAFGHKTDELCKDALPDDRVACRRLAGERLFCALLKRRSTRAKFQGVDGLGEEQEKCRQIDIMENSLDAAKDERLQKDAEKA